jgi:redox-sensitive bicupin YhaK (pirin superfamily)
MRLFFLGNTHTLHYLRYDGNKMAIRLVYDTTQPFVSNGTSHTKDETITYVQDGSIRYDDNSTCCVFYALVVNISPQKT